MNYYSSIGLTAQIVSTEDIIAGTTGNDPQEKIRNYIRQEYQNNNIEYVLLGGDDSKVPSRKFYCVVYFGTGGIEEESYDIPADLYYSALDGTDDLNGNLVYGEVADSTDLLPDVAVGRLPFATQSELASMVHKSVSYQANPVLGEADRLLLVGEYLYDTPVTLGGAYMDLLVDNRNDNARHATIPLLARAMELLVSFERGLFNSIQPQAAEADRDHVFGRHPPKTAVQPG